MVIEEAGGSGQVSGSESGQVSGSESEGEGEEDGGELQKEEAGDDMDESEKPPSPVSVH